MDPEPSLAITLVVIKYTHMNYWVSQKVQLDFSIDGMETLNEVFGQPQYLTAQYLIFNINI